MQHTQGCTSIARRECTCPNLSPSCDCADILSPTCARFDSHADGDSGSGATPFASAASVARSCACLAGGLGGRVPVGHEGAASPCGTSCLRKPSSRSGTHTGTLYKDSMRECMQPSCM